MTTDVISETLDRLAPERHFAADWADVLGRANAESIAPTRRRLTVRRRWVVLVAGLLAILSPLTAVATTNELWFFRDSGRDPGRPAPNQPPPLILKTGSWEGHDWIVAGYRSEDGGLCFALFPSSRGFGGALGCGGFKAQGADGTGGITFLSGGLSERFRWVVGPVVEDAERVVIHLADGEVLRVDAFDVPESLGAIRFYVAVVPMPETAEPRDTAVVRAEGLAADGTVVACIGDGLPC
jgi:hypothetical protein